ncbi:hypothetical protein AcW1_001380 [Taiwanofungus camphoratus]|nr:hypothetical protein AcW1_001380 [Antrodia cinnamomea]
MIAANYHSCLFLHFQVGSPRYAQPDNQIYDMLAAFHSSARRRPGTMQTASALSRCQLHSTPTDSPMYVTKIPKQMSSAVRGRIAQTHHEPVPTFLSKLPLRWDLHTEHVRAREHTHPII